MFESASLGSEIKKGDRVLYIGTGTGHMPHNIEKKTGVDLFKIDLADIRTPDNKDNKFVVANARRLPFADASFDDVFISDVLHHTERQREILAEVKRVLKSGGKAIIFEDTIPEAVHPTTRALIDKLTGWMDDALNLQSKGVNPHNRHSVIEWETMFDNAGFDPNVDVKTWYWGLNLALGKPGSDKRTPMSPFESTCFKIKKLPDKSNN
jgi:SAM-dependent methyltransferase